LFLVKIFCRNADKQGKNVENSKIHTGYRNNYTTNIL